VAGFRASHPFRLLFFSHPGMSSILTFFVVSAFDVVTVPLFVVNEIHFWLIVPPVDWGLLLLFLRLIFASVLDVFAKSAVLFFFFRRAIV